MVGHPSSVVAHLYMRGKKESDDDDEDDEEEEEACRRLW